MAWRPGGFRVLIAGGGVAALESMVALHELAGERVDIKLLAPNTEFAYRPLAVAEPFDLGTVHRFPLAALAGACGAKHYLGWLAAVYPEEHRVRTDRLVPLGYDALLIAVGVRARIAVPGALTFRGVEDIDDFRALLGDLESGRITRVVFAVPGGVAWALPSTSSRSSLPIGLARAASPEVIFGSSVPRRPLCSSLAARRARTCDSSSRRKASRSMRAGIRIGSSTGSFSSSRTE